MVKKYLILSDLRLVKDTEKTNHILGAHKKKVYCYDWFTKILLMEFEGIRIMECNVNRNNAHIRQKLDKIKPFFCSINGVNYKLLLLLKPLDP